MYDEGSEADPLRHFCEKGGYKNIYPKSIAVVETIYKTTVHVPGACSAMHNDPLNGERVGVHRNVGREEGLIVQHVTELRSPMRYVPADHVRVPSIFTQVWGPRLEEEAKKAEEEK